MPSSRRSQAKADTPKQAHQRFPGLLGFLTGTMLLGGLGFWQGWAWWRWAIAPGVNAEQSVQLTITQGTSATEIGQDLETLGLIQSSHAWNVWIAWLRLTKLEGGLKAGTYQFKPSQNLLAIARQIWDGEVVTNSITIPEGFSIWQMAQQFEAQGFFPAETFVSAAKDIPRDEFPWLPEDLPSLEGFLFPDTYFLGSTEPTPQDIIEPMLQQFEAVVLPLYDSDEVPQGLNLGEWVTLASIVEKEAVIPDERAVIAGVFVARLRANMRLETDPTVEYALGIRQTKEQPLTLEQVRTPSPYNTYLNQGLPPGAIASPGLASFEAALNPEETEFLYFVANYDGTHVFSRTLAEHEQATERIRNEVREGR